MSSSFANSYDQFGVDDAYVAPHLFTNSHSTVADFPPSIHVSGGEFVSDPPYYFSSERNDSGPILPLPEEMEHEECYALSEWRRLNAIRIEEKEKREKELLRQIIVQADDYKVEFHKKRVVSFETNKVANREKEQAFVAMMEKFHAEADKDYWKSIAEIIPKEVPTIEKRKGKKDQEKKPSVSVVQGPKPGKPSDLSRMRQILLKLKHDTPPHLKQLPNANEPPVPVA